MKEPVVELPTPSKTKFEETDDSDSNYSEGEEEIERELADVTFEELQKASSDGSHSLYKKPPRPSSTKRANKNRPTEVSCSKPVSRFREVIQAPKKTVCDPRFESLFGTLDDDGFRKRYNFLLEKELPSEKQELQKTSKKSKDPKVIEEFKNRIAWIDKRIKSESTKRTESAILAEHKKKEREATKQGKQPFYLKKSEIRNRRLIEKYNILKGLRSLLFELPFCLCSETIISTRTSWFNSRNLGNWTPSLRKRGGRMLQKIIDTCHIGGPTKMTNSVPL